MTVQISPVNAAWSFLPQPNGDLVVRIDCPIGSLFFFMQAADAKALAAGMDKAASQAKSGLIIPDGVQLPPPPTDGKPQ